MKRGLHRFLALAACVCVLCCAAVPAKADTPAVDCSALGIYDYALVSGTDSLNLRAGPGTEYQWCGSLAAGNWVGLLGESGNWYYVYLLHTGQYGYMSKNYLKRSDSGVTPGANTGVVNNPQPNQFLNLRAAPSYTAQVLGIYYNGSVFTLLSSTADGWYQVQINGNIGYFRHEYVTVNGGNPGGGGAVPPSGQTGYVYAANGKKVNLRSLPSYAGSTIIGQYPSGTPLTVLSASGAFWTVQVQGTVGYMDSTFISVSGGGRFPQSPAPDPRHRHGEQPPRHPVPESARPALHHRPGDRPV